MNSYFVSCVGRTRGSLFLAAVGGRSDVWGFWVHFEFFFIGPALHLARASGYCATIILIKGL